jgi:hypothetical protein
MVIVVVGSGISGLSASSGSAYFSTSGSAAPNTVVFYTSTSFSLGSTTTISGIPGYAMAYAYIGSGSSVYTNNMYSSSTAVVFSTPPGPVYGTPRMIAVSTSSSLNLSTVAGAAAGAGPTWANGSGFVHPNDSNLSAAVWVGTGSWSGSNASAVLTSNGAGYGWYTTGITIG